MSKNETKKEASNENETKTASTSPVTPEMQTRIVTLLNKCKGIFDEQDEHGDVADECETLAKELSTSESEQKAA